MKDWDYQMRIVLSSESAEKARISMKDPSIAELFAVLQKHHAKLKCQFDAFAEYVAEAERVGADKYPLYKWTKATIEEPSKKEKYLKSFTVYIEDNHVYSKQKAELLELDLQLIKSRQYILGISKYDTNPVNNPQIPKQYL